MSLVGMFKTLSVIDRDQHMRSIKVALIVGAVLTLINQHDALFGPKEFSYLKAILTFLVPFCVATYGAVTALKAQADHGDETPADTP